MAVVIVATLAGFIRVAGRHAGRPAAHSLVPTDARDVWAETVSDTPPLAPGAALRIARRYVLRVRVPDNTDAWILDSLALQRMSFSGGAEEWVYLANFKTDARPDAEPEAVAATLQIPVRFDGSVPPGVVEQIF